MCPFYPVGEFGCRLHRRCDDRKLLIKIVEYPVIHEVKNSITDLAEMIEVSLRILVVQLPPDRLLGKLPTCNGDLGFR